MLNQHEKSQDIGFVCFGKKNVYEKRPYSKDKISQMTEQRLTVVLTIDLSTIENQK